MANLRRTNALRCFFAMALRDAGSDTEELYWNNIKPLCKGMNVSALRIDELDHFDNIDQRILAEIEKSDFMVADLTYERPSVYFEAGYAERKSMPVIYTCRADHFSPRSPESFRIHFDIRQRPIIRWTKPKDAVFSRRLKRRITKATAPLVRKRNEKLRNNKAEAEFSRLSLQARAMEIVSLAKERLTRLGFKSVAAEQQIRKEQGWIGYKAVRAGTRRIIIWMSRGTKGDLQRLGFVRLAFDKVRLEPNVSNGTDDLVILCLGVIPSARFEGVFPEYSRVDDGVMRTWEHRKSEENRLSRVHVIHKICSPNEVDGALLAAFE
jgi:hypothetical protein